MGGVGFEKMRNEHDGRTLQEFKSSSAKVNSLDNYMRQAEVAAIAHFLAKEYCRLRRPAVSIRFLPCHVAECCGAGATRRYNVESPLPAGEFVKFCNNLGSWDLDLAHPCLADFCKCVIPPRPPPSPCRCPCAATPLPPSQSLHVTRQLTRQLSLFHSSTV
jgi:hypothetical protein